MSVMNNYIQLAMSNCFYSDPLSATDYNSSKMILRILADITVLIHLLWILFLIFGAVAGVKYLAIKIIHLSGLAFAFVIMIFGWYCPLTYLEAWLRQQHDPTLSYTGSFIAHHIEKLVYLEMSHSALIVLTILLVGFNIWIYMRKNNRKGERFIK